MSWGSLQQEESGSEGRKNLFWNLGTGNHRISFGEQKCQGKSLGNILSSHLTLRFSDWPSALVNERPKLVVSVS